jgi:small ligand-binding sensory domain FIST
MDNTSQAVATRFALGHARSADWREAARAVAEQLGERDDDTLGFLYVTDHLAPHLGDIAAFLAGATGVLTWCGTVGIGICASGTEYFDEPAIVAMACRPPGAEVMPFGNADAAIEAYRAQGAGAAGSFAVVHGDPRQATLSDDIPRLARLTDGFLVGALTSSRGEFGAMAAGPVEGAVSGVLLTGAAVATGLTQGCSPLGGIHEVTEAEDNIVMRLDGRPAMDVLVEVLAQAGITDLRRLAGSLHVALPVTGSDTGDYLVRNLVGIDPETRVIAVGERMRAGDALMFCRRDRQAAEADLRRMLYSLKARAVRPLGGLYFSCLARGPGMFGEVGRELAIVREVLGDVPLVGFFGNGEISFDRLYAYTGVLTLFLDPGDAAA